MLQYDENGKVTLYPYKVKYTRDGEHHEQWALPNKEWWIETANKWPDILDLEFIEVELTPEQLQRFESMLPNIKEGQFYEEYIWTGSFPKKEKTEEEIYRGAYYE